MGCEDLQEQSAIDGKGSDLDGSLLHRKAHSAFSSLNVLYLAMHWDFASVDGASLNFSLCARTPWTAFAIMTQARSRPTGRRINRAENLRQSNRYNLGRGETMPCTFRCPYLSLPALPFDWPHTNNVQSHVHSKTTKSHIETKTDEPLQEPLEKSLDEFLNGSLDDLFFGLFICLFFVPPNGTLFIFSPCSEKTFIP